MRIGKSVTAHGRTVQEALEKAASLLNVSLENVAYDVVRAGSGAHSVCKIRAVCIAPAPDEPKEDLLAGLDELTPPWTLQEVAALSPSGFLRALDNTASAPRLVAPDEPVAHAQEESLREIDHDIAIGFGSIDHAGDLVIRGSVNYGVRVRATGAVTILGDVDAAFVDCGGHLEVNGGILGTARSRHGSVSCHFAHAAYIVAAEKITVAESAVHTNLIAGVEIVVGDVIVGGRAYAHNILWARAAGSEAGVPTRLVAGKNRVLRDKLEDIRELSATIADRIVGLNRLIEQWEPVEQAGSALTPEMRLALWRSVAEKNQLTRITRRLADERAQLIAQLDGDKSARIKIRDRVYPATVIEIDDGGMEIRTITHFTTYSKDYITGALRMTPYS